MDSASWSPASLKENTLCRVELQLSLHLADISQSHFEMQGGDSTHSIAHSLPVFKRKLCSVKRSLKLNADSFLADISVSSSVCKMVNSGSCNLKQTVAFGCILYLRGDTCVHRPHSSNLKINTLWSVRGLFSAFR